MPWSKVVAVGAAPRVVPSIQLPKGCRSNTRPSQLSWEVRSCQRRYFSSYLIARAQLYSTSFIKHSGDLTGIATYSNTKADHPCFIHRKSKAGQFFRYTRINW